MTIGKIFCGKTGLQLIARVVGPAKALDDARSARLVTSTDAANQRQEAALAFAGRVPQCGPVSIAETKRALYRCATANADEADAIALNALAATAACPEWWKGMSALIEKRPAAFRVEAS